MRVEFLVSWAFSRPPGRCRLGKECHVWLAGSAWLC
ncbi:uncharacterized protein PgNI_00411 [Pyricularia grisea]|uniref:Uncharacterized protein n=1 Tax=Pyricularia grisea TaxID=148305 RepID=A0A6P8BN31_PYRGI|nr:uncharacterized protein PgNI_00411 [Pyricularia grisea]TLD17842.1 hypothetical protein PgNI_00411 [Pyricularia grisea]